MALVSLVEVKQYLGITDNSKDPILQLFISGVDTTIKNHCKREFEVKTYTEDHRINHKIFTNNYPIISVESISRCSDNESYKVFKSYIEMLDYQYLSMSNRLKYADTEESLVTITYKAGYEEIPSDLKLAAIELVALKYKNSPAGEDRLGKDNEREGTYQATYTKSDGLPSDILKVLNEYKKVSV